MLLFDRFSPFLSAFPKFRASASYEADYVLDQYNFLSNIRIYKTERWQVVMKVSQRKMLNKCYRSQNRCLSISLPLEIQVSTYRCIDRYLTGF